MIIKFIKFIYNDIKTDIQFLIGFFRGKPVGRKKALEYKQQLEKYGGFSYNGMSNLFIDIIKTYWIMFFMFFLFFIMGMWYAQQDCQDICNTFIQENYVDKIGDELVYQQMGERVDNFKFVNLTILPSGS